jgi:hypothetical protein
MAMIAVPAKKALWKANSRKVIDSAGPGVRVDSLPSQNDWRERDRHKLKKRLGYPEVGANTSIHANAFIGSFLFH